MRLRCEELCARIIAEEGHRALGWRDVPVRLDADRPRSPGRSAPVIRQLAHRAPRGRRRGVRAQAVRDPPPRREGRAAHRRRRGLLHLHEPLATARWSTRACCARASWTTFYPDLARARLRVGASRSCTRASRRTRSAPGTSRIPSTSWPTTARSTRCAATPTGCARASRRCARSCFGGDLQKLFPIADERWSDSATLDAMLELLVRGGRSLAHARGDADPAGLERPLARALPDEVRAFYEYHATLVEPWDGPAAVIATDGTQRRRHARPQRPAPRPLAAHRRRARGARVGGRRARPRPGDDRGVRPPRARAACCCSTRTPGASCRTRRSSACWPAAARTAAGSSEHKLYLDDLRPQQVAPLPPDELGAAAAGVRLHDRGAAAADRRRWRATPRSRSARWATTRRWPPSRSGPKLLPAYFKQQFAQVTNPPIDPQREELVMSLRVGVGAIGNLLGERPEDCRRVTMLQPVLQNGELEKLRHLRREGFRAQTLSHAVPGGRGRAPGSSARSTSCAAQASQAVWNGTTILILSDRGVDAELAPIGPLLATAAVHSHLVREGARTMCGLVVESGEPRETMHVALLLGYGASAVNPYLALETLRALHAAGELGELHARRGAPALRQGDRQGPAEGLLEDGHLDHPELPRRADLRGRGARPAARRPLLHGHHLARRRPRAARHRRRGVRAARARASRRCAPPAPSRSSTPAASTSSACAASTTTGTRTRSCACSARCATTTYASFEAFAAAIDGAERPPHDAARPARARRPTAPPMPLEEVEPSSEIVKRFATGAMSFGSISPRGARDAGHRDEPPRRALQHGRGRRGRGALDPRSRTATCGARRSSRSPRRASA